jgi:hypothetical protein
MIEEEHAPPYREEDKEGGKWELLSLRGERSENHLYFIYLFVFAINYAHVVRRSRYQEYLFNGKFCFLTLILLHIQLKEPK